MEWLATVSDAHGRRGRWVDMLQDFSFKIIHQPRLRHTNVDALSRNLVGLATDDDDFRGEIQDIGNTQTDAPEGEREIRFIHMGKETKWLDARERIGSLYNIMRVVLASTTRIMPTTSSCLWLTLY
jgi:hypothetical protein